MPGFTFIKLPPAEVADCPAPMCRGSEAIRELCLLGLSHEASLGILRVLLRRRNQTAATDPSEW